MDINVSGTVHVVIDIPCLKDLLGMMHSTGILSSVKPKQVKTESKKPAPVSGVPKEEATKPVPVSDAPKEEAAKPVPVSDAPKEEATKPVPVAETVITHELLRKHLLQVRNAARKAGKNILPQEQLKEKLNTFGVGKLNELSPEQAAEMYAWVDKENANA